MKFPQLNIGQRFEWRGRIYTKSGPVAAVDVETRQAQMIPRSALVNPVDGNQPPPVRRAPEIRPEQLEPLLAAYRRETLAWAAGHLEQASSAALEQAMAEIARRLLADAG